MSQKPCPAESSFEPCVVQLPQDLAFLAQHVYAQVGNRALITGYGQGPEEAGIEFSSGGYRYAVSEILYDTLDSTLRLISGIAVIKIGSEHDRPPQDLGIPPRAFTLLLGDLTDTLPFYLPCPHEGILLSSAAIKGVEKPPIPDTAY